MPVFLVFAEDDHDLVGINKCSSQRATRVRLHKHFFVVFFCFQMDSIFSNNENYKERREGFFDFLS